MGKSKIQPETEVSALKEMVNLPEAVEAFGRTYLIQKFTFGPMTQALEYIGPMGYLLRRLGEFPHDKKGNLKVSADQMTEFAVTAISVVGPSVFGLVSIATKEPVEWLEEQDPMDGIKLFIKVVEKNLDFLSRDNLELVTKLVSGLAQRIPKSGGDTSAT